MDPNYVYHALLLMVSLSAIAGSIAQLRRRPPLVEELYRDFVRRDELIQLREEYAREREEYIASLNSLSDRVASLEKTVNRALADIERAIGVLEGQLGSRLAERRP